MKQDSIMVVHPDDRSRQTAEIMADAYGMGAPEIVDSLVPGTPFDEFEKWCSDIGEKKVVAIVGHEPHLGALVTWLLTARSESCIRLKKGGACLVEFDSEAQSASGTLNWLLTPRQLSGIPK